MKAEFNKVFNKIELSANVRTNLKNTIVDDIKVTMTDRTVNVHLLSDMFIDESCMLDLKEDIIEAIPGIDDVRTSISYVLENCSDEEKIQRYWYKIEEIVKNRNRVCYSSFKNAQWTLDKDILEITVDNNSAFLFERYGLDREIGNILMRRLDINVKVVFRNKKIDKKVTEEKKELLIKRSEEYMSQLAEKSSMESTAPVVSDDSFSTRRRAPSSAPVFTPIEEDPISITEACAKQGNVVVQGRVFLEAETRETKNGKIIAKTAITDDKDSVYIKIFVPAEDYGKYKKYVNKGKAPVYIKVKGNISPDKYMGNELVLIANAINEAEPPKIKMDNAPEKRVELHLHTNMSMMDGVNSAAEYINRAIYWGHKAIAFTDHGVVQAFPDVIHAIEGKNIKPLYGCEGYMVNDMGAIVKNSHDQDIDNTYVVFDLETTGLNNKIDKIIEIGAVKIKNGEIIDRYSTFVNPQKHIEPKISKLTGIYDEMVSEYGTEDDIVPEFLEFIGDSILVAHNAAFDTGFIRRFAKEKGITLENTVVDTLELSRALLPTLNNFKLDTICNELNVSLENHHRAVHDAEATALCFLEFLKMLKEKGISNIDDINAVGVETIDKSKISKRYHIIIFAKNQAGLKNLYELVSQSHIKYFNKRSSRPCIPKSELLKYRDNLILGSACEAGDLYEAVYNDMPEEDIKEIVDFYDYLEVQPIGNNRFMINNTSRNGKSVSSEEDLININKKIVALGDKYNKPVVATGDVHFIDPECADFRRIVQIGEGFRLEDCENQAPLYFRTTEEMLAEFSYLDKGKAYEIVVTNTNLVADMIDDGIIAIPHKKCPPKIEGADDDLRSITTARAKEIYGDPLPEYIENRLNKELDSIIGNGYAVLYIIARLLVKDSNEHGYIVGSRGSVGSSFAATMAGITEVNPLDPHYVCPNCKYSDFTSEDVQKVAGNSGFDLPDKKCPICGTEMNKDGQAIPFETFLGFKGDKEPDIDLNFSGEDQIRAHKYCETLFEGGNVYKAGTISTLQHKTVYGYVLKYCEQKGIVMKSSEIARLVEGCVGVKRSTGQHPGGLVIVPDYTDIHEFCPVQHPANKADSGVTTTHFDYHSIDACLLKLDMLGHDVPTILRMYKDITGFDPLDVPMNDKATMSLFTSPEALGVTEEQIHCKTGTLGLPEFGTNFVIGMLMETQPKSFSGLVKISGLSHGTDVWNGNAQELIEQGICTLNDVIPTRDDIMVYLMLHKVPDADAFSIMENVRKGRGLTSEEEALMREHDVPDWYIKSCKKIKYMFPKGHAVAYCTNTFRIGYFKINYPLAFYAGHFSVKYENFNYSLMCFGLEKAENTYNEIMAMENDATDKDKAVADLMKLVIEMYIRGYNFTKIDIYRSEATKFKVIKNDEGTDVLLPPLCTIDGLGISAAESIVEARADGEFTTLEDMAARTNLGKKLIQLLKDAGVVDGIRDTDQLTLF